MGGTASGTAGGTVGGTAGGTTGGDGSCDRLVEQAGPVVPDIMIVLDRSGSMKPQVSRDLDCSGTPQIWEARFWTCAVAGVNCNNAPYAGTTVCGGMATFGLDRWTPAVKGLKSITSQFQDKVSFGLTVFPGPGQQGQGRCVTGVERVPVTLNSASQIASALDMTSPDGNTPTGPTLQAVREQIEKKVASPDAQVPPQYVLLVTDGEPTCPGSGNEPRNQTTKALDDLLKAGVKTYVIGYDASVDANLARVLTEFAKRGGTGDFYPVQDEASLVEQFKSITGVVADCTKKLNNVPARQEYVKVSIDGTQIFLGKDFSLQGANVIIEGEACAKLRDGVTHLVDVSVECEPQVPIY